MKKEIYDSMVSKIRKHMKLSGINARQLAEKANVGRSFVYDVLRGKSKNPTYSKLVAIADVLGISTSCFVGRDSNLISMRDFSSVRYLNNKNIRKIVEAHQGKGGREIDKVGDAVEDDDNAQFDVVFYWPVSKDFSGARKDNEMEEDRKSLKDYLYLYRICDDQMEPTFSRNNFVLVDTRMSDGFSSGVFLVYNHYEVLLRRLEVIPTRSDGKLMFAVTPDNPRYMKYEAGIDDIKILGKVILYINQLVSANSFDSTLLVSA